MSELSKDQALQQLNDSKLPELQRDAAAKELAKYPTPDVIGALINALEDPDDGVRFASSQALIDIGVPAMQPLLEALLDKSDSVWLREGAYRVFHDTRSATVQQATAALVKALKGPAASLSTTEAAGEALVKLAQQG